MRYHLIPVRMAIIKTTTTATTTANAGEGVEKRESSCTVDGNIIGRATEENSMEVP